MLKKLALLAMAAAALAAPVAAQATTLQSPPGTVLPIGAKVRAYSTNMQSLNAAYETRCNNVTIEGEVINRGGPGKVAKIMPYAAPNGMVWSGCYAGGIENVTMTEVTAGVISLGAASPVGGFSAEFVESDGGYYNKCHMSGLFAFVYESGASTFSVPGSVLSAYGSGCPSEQEWSGSFSLTTPNGTPVKIYN